MQQLKAVLFLVIATLLLLATTAAATLYRIIPYGE